MTTFQGEAAKAVMQAQRHWEIFNATMAAFRSELVRNDWKKAEEERDRAIEALGSYCDEILIGTKMAVEQGSAQT